MRIALGIEYDGTDFHGWQRLSHGPSVQAAIEAALSKVADEPVEVTCAGRTDAGVQIRFTEAGGEERTVLVDYVIAATGRTPNVGRLGLEMHPPRQRVEGEGRSIYFYDDDNHMFELHTGTLTERLARYAKGLEAAQ